VGGPKFQPGLQFAMQSAPKSTKPVPQNEIKTHNELKVHNIAAMLFCFEFPCLFWGFRAHESVVFKITVGLAKRRE